MNRTHSTFHPMMISAFAMAMVTASVTSSPDAAAGSVIALSTLSTEHMINVQFGTDPWFWNYRAILTKPGAPTFVRTVTGMPGWKTGDGGQFHLLAPDSTYQLRLQVQWSIIGPFVDMPLPPPWAGPLALIDTQ